ncbi:RHS repeat-associated core domain-containing protein [Streptomyces sp. NPDC008121]|uniref:scabin-related ADP-ribosyltransferase n=1 Tax=Streptomyces sp. NPDC008121 TaxID=3364809 RepID=UPI0036ECCD90
MTVTMVPGITTPGTATATRTAGAAAAAGTGVSGTVAMGGGATGNIHERTGAFQTALPLVSLPGRGEAGIEIALAYDQTAAAAGSDRHGLGQGMGLGQPFIDPADGGTLHTASGAGSYPIRTSDTEGTGLGRYLLKDLALRDAPGTLPPREGLEDGPREYRWVLTYHDGRKHFFSPQGDLVAEQDLFGNEAAYEWETHGGQHRLLKAVDAFGQAVAFDYSAEGEVTITSPVRSDGKQPRIVLHLDGGRLASLAYPEDQKIQLAWDHAPDGMPGRLLTRVEAPTGAVTRIGYDQPHGTPTVSSLKVTDTEGRSLAPERTFRLGTEGEHAGHDFTGRGRYASADALFDSADTDYRYVTELSDGHSTVRSVYNSLHLLKERTVSLNADGELKPVRSQQLTYEGERENGQVPPPASALPANYGKPVRATDTVHDPATGMSRTATETARFDEHGRETERTDVTGAVTVTAYDATALPRHTGDTGPEADSGGGDGQPAGYGLPVKVTVTGSDGAQTITEHTLSADRKSVASTTEAVKNAGEQEPSARTVTRFRVDGHGELSGRTVTWAPGAEPQGTGGPDALAETYESTVDTGARTRTGMVKSGAGVSSEVTDLVTGQVIRVTDPAGRTAETGYDLAGRPVSRKVPSGPDGESLLTTTAYTPTTTTVTAPGQDGRPHVTVEHRDLLGRVVKRTDNVREGRLTGDPAARTLQGVTFEDGGRTAKVTDQAGRITLTTSDYLGRPVKTTAPSGITRLTIYADAATADTSSITTLTLPAGETDPAKATVATTVTRDYAERPVTTASSYADGTTRTGSTTAYDSLGRVKRTVSGDVAVTPSYGTGGAAEAATLTPQNTGTFPGQKITAFAPADLTGAPVVKTLIPGSDGEGRQGTVRLRNAAGQVTEERRPDGSKTTFALTDGGQIAQTVSPSGIRTSYRYDRDTGQLLETAVTSADGKTVERTGYSYDPHTGAVTEVFSPGDKSNSLISYTYDADGHVTSVTYPDGRAVRQDYGDDGQLEKTTDTAGLTTYYTYNRDGTIAKAVQREHDDTASPVTASVVYTYDGLGRIIKTDRGNGVTTETEFTDAHQIRHQKTTSDGQLITEAAYTYDSHNNLTSRTDTGPAASADGTPGGPVTTTTTGYTYDAYNRLTGSEVSSPDGEKLSSRYTLNVSGDVVKTETTRHSGDQAGQTAVITHGIDAAGRLATRTVNGQEYTQTFDTDGNLTTAHDNTVWTYNLHGQPVAQTRPDGSAVRYTYWADGTRATTTETPAGADRSVTDGSSPPEQTTRFYYTPDGAILNDTHTSSTGAADAADGAEAQDAVTASYLIAGTRHARTLTGGGADAAAPTGAGYLITDRHGNTTALTTSSGQVSQAWQYTDYGQPAGPGATPSVAGTPGQQPPAPAGAGRQPFTFAGEYTGPGGTQYLKTRLYDPGTGRFTTPDPEPRHNRYQAMGANPITNVDPDGTTEIPDWASYLLMGLTAGAAVLSAIATWGASAAAMGISLAGAALDLASTALETAALATGRRQLDDPLNITALAVGSLGILLGGVSALAPSKHIEYATGYIKHSLRNLPVPYTSKAQRHARRFPASNDPGRASSEEIVVAHDYDRVPEKIRHGVSSRVHVSSTLQPLYRNDSRPPHEIFEQGFTPRSEGPATSLLEYQALNTASKFVGFSRNRQFATTRWHYEYTYEIMGAPGGIVMNKTTRHPDFIHQQEYAFPYGVRREFVYKATSRNGIEYFNPQFDPDALLKSDTHIPHGPWTVT